MKLPPLAKLPFYPILQRFGLHLLGWCCVCGLVSVSIWIQPQINKAFDDIRESRNNVAHDCIKKALVLENAGRTHDAFSYYQLALEGSINAEQVNKSGLMMGEFLTRVAKKTPVPYASMARLYLEAVLDRDENQQTQLRAYESLIEIDRITLDRSAALSDCSKALSLATNVNQKAQIVLNQLEAFVEIGEWPEVNELFIEASQWVSNTVWQNDFEYLSAIRDEQILIRDDWLMLWDQQTLAVEPYLDRSDMYKQTVKKFLHLFEVGPASFGDDCLFRIARILFHEGNHHEANRYLEAFIDWESKMYRDETLNLIIRLAKIEGSKPRARMLMSRFMKQYSLSSQTTENILNTISKLEEVGFKQESFNLLTRYIKLPQAKNSMGAILSKAVLLSNTMGQFETSAHYLEKLLTLSSDEALQGKAIFNQAETCLQKGEFNSAENWLIRYLDRFEYGKLRSEALFKLFDVMAKRKGAALADLMLVGSSAAIENPRDPRAVSILASVARMLEDIGLQELAQEQYRRIALINYVSIDGHKALVKMDLVGQAMVGQARCLLALNKKLEADRLLRELCNNYHKGPVHSEAAYWWSCMALDAEQLVEAERRIHLADLEDAPVHLRVKSLFIKNLLRIPRGKETSETIEALCDTIAELPENEHADLVIRAYRTCAIKLAEQEDLESLKTLLSSALNGQHADILPTQEIFLRLVKTSMTKEGLALFVDDLQEHKSLLELSVDDLESSIATLMKLDNKLNTVMTEITEYL